MMNKWIFALVGAAALSATQICAAEDENLWTDGGFEKTKPATAAELAKFKAKKWDTDHFVLLRPGWCSPKKTHQMRLVDCAKDPEQEDNVRSGTKALMLKSSGHFFTEKKFPKGKYKWEMYVKGEGRIRFITYNYKKNGAIVEQAALHGGLFTLGNDWKKFTFTAEMGGKKPEAVSFIPVIVCVDGKPIYIDDIVLTKVK